MSTDAAGAREELFTAFGTFWAGRTPIAWQNVPFDPSDLTDSEKDDGWVRVTLLHAGGDIAALGTTFFRRTGQIIVQCFAEVGRGMDHAYTLAEAVASFYQTHRGNVRIRQPSIVDIGPEGAWYQLNVSGEFSYDHVQT